MEKTTKANLLLIIISTFGGIVVPQLLLPGYFSGITDASPSWGMIVWFTYLGILASIIGAILFIVLFRKERDVVSLVVRLVQATALAIAWTIVICYAADLLYIPQLNTWSVGQTILAYFQFPAYASAYVWSPAATWFISVLLYDAFYLALVKRDTAKLER